MNKNKKRFLSLFLTISLFLSSKIVGKNIDNLFAEFYYGNYLDDTSIEKIIDYDSSYGIKYVGRYVPQGVCVINDKTIISLYDSLGLSNSILCVYNHDSNTYSKVNLDMTAHVGGICYDDINELLWVTGKSGNVRCYDINDLDKSSIKSLSGDIFVGDELINHKGVCSAAYITINSNKLYVGNFVLHGNGILKEYDILKNGNDIKLNYVKDYVAPNKTQGICFYAKDDKEYIMFSRSYGTEIDSLLHIYEFDENFNANISNSTQYYMDPMLEQVVINDDELLAVFESNASFYSDGSYEDDLVSVDINRLIKKHEIN